MESLKRCLLVLQTLAFQPLGESIRAAQHGQAITGHVSLIICC